MSKIIHLSQNLGMLLLKHKLMVATAESCTGGWVSQSITEIPRSSQWFDRGFVTYSNQSKIEMLDVLSTTLEKFGAVSEEIAIEMAQGAIKNSKAQISVSITGIAGPDGGSNEKPVGTVWIGVSNFGKTITQLHHFTGDRHQIRQKSTVSALSSLIQLLEGRYPLS